MARSGKVEMGQLKVLLIDRPTMMHKLIAAKLAVQASWPLLISVLSGAG